MHIPENLSNTNLQICWKSSQSLGYEKVQLTNDLAILDNKEGFIYYFETDSWDEDIRKSYKCFVKDDRMLCLNIPHTEEELEQRGKDIEGFFKEKVQNGDGTWEWVQLPYKFVIHCSGKDVNGTCQPETDVWEKLDEKEKVLMKELEKILHQKQQLQHSKEQQY